MSSSTHQIAVVGVDKTAQTFASIQARAISAGRRISSVVGGAIAAAGAYLSFRSIKDGVTELGKLSDMAMRAGTSVDELTQTTLALQIAGLNVPIEAMTRSLMYMRKATGETGIDNFYKTAEAISKINDPAKRGAELMRVFGRSGIELQPLIEGGTTAIDKIRTLTSIMPGVSQSAADAGDAAADALTTFGTGAHNLFLRVIGSIAGLWGDEFPGGVRAGALSAINYIEWFIKHSFAILTKWGSKVGLIFEQVGNVMFNGYSIEQAIDEYNELADILDSEQGAKLAAIDKAREDYKTRLGKLSVDDLAGAFGPRRDARPNDNGATEAAARATRIANQLITGGSNNERRLAMLGPEYNEARKQTDLLKEIAKNTKKSAEDSSDTIEYPETDLGA